ncbi:hypothetical protein KJ068_02550 [bacterium]|nr:hypothetical protein [bacterium]
MKVFIISIALTLFSEVSQAQYFSDEGFTLGMSKISALRLIREMGLRNLQENKNSVIGNRFIDGVWLFYEFHFCDDKLVFYRKDNPPSIKNLIFILHDLSSKYGKDFKANTRISMTAGGEIRSLLFFWQKPFYRVEISYDVYTTNESLTTRYSVPNKCIKE